jgi:AraC-like DNA-binding protein
MADTIIDPAAGAPYYPLSIQHLAYREVDRSYDIPWHSHDVHQWYCVVSGEVHMRYAGDERAFILRAGDAVLMQPGIPRGPYCGGLPPCYVIAQFANRSLRLEDALGTVWRLDDEAHSALGAMVRELQQPGRNAWHQRHALLVQLVIGHARSHEHNAPPLSRLNAAAHREVVGRAEDFIRAQLHRRLTRDEIAASVFLSPTHCNRLFRQVLHMSITGRLTALRLERARHLLLDSTLSISQIAGEVGFSSFSHFTRTFQRHTGTTPGDYRRSRGQAWRTLHEM